MSEVYNWDIAKQYLAAHYYLSEERPISISEAQRAQLGALHLHVSHGPYNAAIEVPDLFSCTAAERKKRVLEWAKLGMISRETAMRKFIDLISNLFPNWSRFRKLFYEFELEWINMPEEYNKKKVVNSEKEPAKCKSVDLRTSKQDFKKKGSKLRLSDIENKRDGTPNVFSKILEMKKNRNRRPKSRIDCCEPDKLILSRRKEKKEIDKTKFPRIHVSIKKYQEQEDGFLKEFVEDLQSYRGGNLRRTSATKMPKGFEWPDYGDCKYQTKPKDFNKQLNDYSKELIEKEIGKLNPHKKEEVTATSTANCLKEKLNRIQNVLERMEHEYSELDKRY